MSGESIVVGALRVGVSFGFSDGVEPQGPWWRVGLGGEFVAGGWVVPVGER